MIDVRKWTLKTGPPVFVTHFRSWLRNKISMIKAASVALLGLILILFVRVIVLFFRKAGVPEIDLNDIER